MWQMVSSTRPAKTLQGGAELNTPPGALNDREGLLDASTGRDADNLHIAREKMLPTPTNLESVNRSMSQVCEYGDLLNRPSAVNRSILCYGPLELLLQFHVRKACVCVLVAGKDHKRNLR